MITFESLDVVSSYLHSRYISREYGSSLYTKVIRARSWLQEQKVLKIPIPHCKTLSTIHNTGSVIQRAMRFTCNVEFLAVVDRMV